MVTPKAEPAGRTYTAEYGDTLWQIAERFLGKGSRCTEIVKRNGQGSGVPRSGQVPEWPEKKRIVRQVRFIA